MKVYWWRARPNFGDELTPLVLARFGVNVRWAPPEEARLVAVGSVLEHLPDGWSGTLVGAGSINPRSTLPDLADARVLAVRGRLTRKRLGVRCAVGDPGILAPDLIEDRPDPAAGIEVAPHIDDRNMRWGCHLDLAADPLEVIHRIAGCDRLVSSSLHALVVADAFGIPHWWEPSPRVIGGSWKFDDYLSAFGLDAFPAREWRVTPAALMADRQERLRSVLREVSA